MSIKMPKCIIYTRISCKNNNSFYNCSSLDSQLEFCRKFAKQNNFTICDEISEIKSAFKERKKSEYSKMLRNIYRHKWGNDGELKAIIVCDVSRFSRNLRQGLSDLHKLENKGITVYSVDQNCQWGPSYTSTKAQKIRFRNFLIQAEDESENKSLRQKRSYKFRRARGEYIGKAPYGFKIRRTKNRKRLLTENNNEQKIIKIIKNKYENGITMNNIAYELNNKKLYRRNKEWTSNKISYIINRDNKYFKSFKNMLGSLKNISDDKKMFCDNPEEYEDHLRKRKIDQQNYERNNRYIKRLKKSPIQKKKKRCKKIYNKDIVL